MNLVQLYILKINELVKLPDLGLKNLDCNRFAEKYVGALVYFYTIRSYFQSGSIWVMAK